MLTDADVCSGEADVIVRRCGLGGLEPAEVVQDQVLGPALLAVDMLY
jgi:hypothetical protein